jgi:histidine triad (HIT) family protein
LAEKAANYLSQKDCVFCDIVSGIVSTRVVYSDEVSLAFLDRRPIFPGHCLLIPKNHYETIEDLPTELIGPLFSNCQRIAKAVRIVLEADGTFLGINNKISQSVPHVHIHIVPRRAKDGLRGFFWPRQKYESEQQAIQIQEAIRSELSKQN